MKSTASIDVKKQKDPVAELIGHKVASEGNLPTFKGLQRDDLNMMSVQSGLTVENSVWSNHDHKDSLLNEKLLHDLPDEKQFSMENLFSKRNSNIKTKNERISMIGGLKNRRN